MQKISSCQWFDGQAETMLAMKKLDIAVLKRAYDNADHV